MDKCTHLVSESATAATDQTVVERCSKQSETECWDDMGDVFINNLNNPVCVYNQCDLNDASSCSTNFTCKKSNGPSYPGICMTSRIDAVKPSELQNSCTHRKDFG